MTKRQQAQSLAHMAESNLAAATTLAKSADIFGLYFDMLPTELRQQLDNNLV